MLDVGDTATLNLTVTPFDATTAAGLVVTSPAGVVSTPSPTTSDGGNTWVAYFLVDEAGPWRADWTVTGEGAGVERDTIYVFAPLPAGESYATLSDLATWLGTEPDANAGRLLVRASRRVDSALIGAYYAVDDDGLPTDAKVAAALRDATCAQVEWWDEIGDTTGTGAGGEWADVSIGKVKLTTGTSNRAGDPPSKRRLCADAVEVLHRAGLLPVSPYMVG